MKIKLSMQRQLLLSTHSKGKNPTAKSWATNPWNEGQCGSLQNPRIHPYNRILMRSSF